MKTIKTNKANLEAIASELNGKLWMKGDKIRIYVSGGNNYQYDGSWYYEISADGGWDVKCYLTSGYNNKNRETYVDKHLNVMVEDMNSVLDGSYSGDFKQEDGEEVAKQELPADASVDKILALNVALPIERNPYYNPEVTPIRRIVNLSNTSLIDYYHGCGEGCAYIKNEHVVAFRYYGINATNEIANEPTGFEKVYCEFSCTQICFK